MRNRDYFSRIASRAGALILSLIVAVTMVPAFAYADSESPDEITYIEYSPDVEIPDESTLLEQYLDQKSDEFTGETVNEEDVSQSDEGTSEESINSMPRLAGKSRGAQLSGINRAIYDELAAGLTKIADGQTAESRIRVTTYQKGCDFALIIHSLMTDMPYEMYWYDKTAEPNPVILLRSAGQVYVYFAVAEAYRGTFRGNVGSGKFAWYDLNGKTDSVRAAVSNAQQIVSDYAGAEDLDMMAGYRDEICSLTDYNQTAMDDPDEPYGDPWQLIYVFDGDPDTTVVCEGYSKAFQYLCDMSEFSNNTIECYTIYGSLVSKSDYVAHIGSYSSPKAYATDRNNPDLEGHMWNVIHMDDGRNYLADITNCDLGHAGYPDKLFMAYYMNGSGTDELDFQGWGNMYLDRLIYMYDTTSDSLYYQFELEMADSPYDAAADKIVRYPAIPATCTEAGKIEYWMKAGRYYADNYCLKEITEKETAAAALGHSYSVSGQTLDTISYRCSRCGDSYTESEVIVDRPKVKISKPSRAAGGFTAKWKKLSAKNRKKISGFEIQYSTNRTFSDAITYAGLTKKTAFGTVKTAKKSAKSKKITKLKRKTTYYVRIRTYKWIGGVKHVSAWSSVRKVRTK